MIDIEGKRRNAVITDEVRTNCYDLFKAGFDYNKIASITGVGSSTIRYMVRAVDLVRNRDFKTIRETSNFINNATLLKWACKANRVDEKEFFESLVNYNQPQEQPEEKPVEKTDKKEAEKEPACYTDIEDAIHVATKLMTADIVKAIEAQTDSLLKKMEQIATIIQSCSKNEIEKANANADIAVQEQKRAYEALQSIRTNTKNLRIIK